MKKRRRKKIRKLPLNKKTLFISLGVIVICLAALLFVLFKWVGSPDDYTPDDYTPEDIEETIPDEDVSENEPEPVIQYPAPDYDFVTEEVNVEIEGLERSYNIAWVSDLHMITDHEAGDVNEEFLATVEERYNTLSVTEDGTMHGDQLWPEIIKFLNYTNFDAIIFGGDIMDYCSNSNMELFMEGYEQLRAPVLYIRADHDYGAWYGGETFSQEDVYNLHAAIDGDSLDNKHLDLGEFMIVGVNNSTKDISEEQLSINKDLFGSGKPIIAVTHVPYESTIDTSLSELSMQVRNKIYYWRNGEQFSPNDKTKKYINMIYDENTPVEQVLAGHLHAQWDGPLTNQVRQHIFTPAFQGVIGIIHVIPGDN